MTDLNTIQAFEERSFNAWPTRRGVLAGGWLYRLGDGYTNRANSINAIAQRPSFEGVLPFAEQLCRENGVPPVFRLSPLAPPQADAALEHAGYTAYSPTVVMTAPIAAVAAAPDISIETHPSEEWLAGFARLAGLSEGNAAAHGFIVGAILQQAAFATVRYQGKEVGYGLAVTERGAVGLFDLVVDERLRGRGLGRTMIEALTAWGAGHGAETAYLQVAEANAAAIRLYDRLGFRTLYRYHYRLPSTGRCGRRAYSGE